MQQRNPFLRRIIDTIFLTALTLSLASAQNRVPGRILVKFRPGVSEAQGQNIAVALGARSNKVIGGAGVHVVSLPATANENAFLNAFKQRPEAEFVEFDAIVPPADIVPNDAGYASEWHLPRISAPAAWSISTGSASVIIAIIDTGVDGSHEDLAPKMVAGWNIFNNNSDARDVYGHGTAVAGTAAAASNNALGVASVCWNCWIMPVRISDTSGMATTSDIAAGLTWAADHGARVANISYSVTSSGTVSSAATYFQSRGGVVSVSAGNSAAFDSSADNPAVLTTSATDSNDVLYSWSNTGNNVDLAAPGCVYTTNRGGGYGAWCGTSFSAPIVAGVAALVLSNSPGISPAQLTSRLQQSADDLGATGKDPFFGYGRVNAARALASSAPQPSDATAPTISITTPTAGSTVSGAVTIKNSASDNVGVVSVTCYVDGTPIATLTIAPFNCSWNTSSTANGGHTVSATARDAAGNASTASNPVTVSNVAPQPAPPADTTPPVISITSPASGAMVSGNISITVVATDNVRVLRVELYVDGKLSSTSTAAPWTTKWNTNGKLAKGAHTLQTKAYDAAGNSGVSTVMTVYK